MQNFTTNEFPSFLETQKCTVAYQGKLFQYLLIEFSNHTREFVRRPPGTRLIITKKDEKGTYVLLTKEFRHEHDGYDYRLPGGKVFDTFAEFDAVKTDEEMYVSIEEAARKECREETGIVPETVELFHKTNLDGTLQWNLYYFVVDGNFLEGEQDLQHGEEIDTEWYTLDEVEKLCYQRSVEEDKSRAVLYEFIASRR